MSQRVWGLGLFAVVTAIASIAACRQLVGITDNPPEDLATTFCGLPYGTSACASCAQASCCAESTACSRDPVCSAYESCLGNCNGDPKCRSQCTLDNPGATASDVSALSACLASNCETACGLECGGFAGYLSEPDAAAACQSCTCKAAQTCAVSEACDAYWRCFRACPATDCESYCGTVNDAGLSLFTPLGVDFSGACRDACGAGADWSCVGTLSWPRNPPQQLTYTQSLYDPLTDTPAVGVNFAVCTFCPCVPLADGGLTGTLLGQGISNDAGLVTVLFSNPAGSDGLGVVGCAELTSVSYLTGFDYTGNPTSWPFDVTTLSWVGTQRLTVFTSQDIQAIYQATLGTTPDPLRGTIVFGVGDCTDNPAANVRVTLTGDGADSGVVEFYGMSASVQQKATMRDGNGGFVAVPPGNYTIAATPAGMDQPSNQQTITVVAGYVTGVSLRPIR
jgi:hypothetical protein